ncbi:polyketide beta-ketoacyl:ACP synthase [Aurantimonas aggregata]|uniref:Polyketide beta-ketoacyl:ACP synthase n=1 Tax=Aurantimonas aggregata TaxID=2047720 RepID=A0A6L9MCF3_9HYPH|nr:beta-ketoacyl synthase N-terminal-like domain-containing protein [Aurantimonas aggregata]NDV85381.1 polyketide beta-ketoacyl:ACP synthase [Aurantimonas aggregata]
MPKAPPDTPSIVVTGIGVACGLGHGKAAFRDGLFAGRDLFSHLARPGREAPEGDSAFVGIEMSEPPAILPARLARTTTFGERVAIAVLDEAWREAGLETIDPLRIGLVVGGTNLAAREQALAAASFAGRLAYVPPRHGHIFLDTDIGGLCTATYPIRGFAYSVGAASASGTVAIIQAMDAIRSGRVDVCIALGALQDVSAHDLQAMRAMGAMGTTRFADRPGAACRPMDRGHDGFIYGEASAALVLCRSDMAGDAKAYGTLLGSALVADGTRGPEPDSQGQVRAATNALTEAGLTAADIDYVNGHATGTPAGDAAELAAYRTLGLTGARINATKSILGHGLAAAGAIEVAAVLIQIEAGRLHPTRNLDNPLDPRFDWVGAVAVPHAIRHALKLSFGFGGTSAALVIGAPDKESRQ